MSTLATMETPDMVYEIDPNASPTGSTDTNTTPATEFSPPNSPFQHIGLPKNKRALARKKLASLTLDEKVRPLPRVPRCPTHD